MPGKDWIARAERQRREAEIADSRAMDAIFQIVALVLLALFAQAIIHMV